MLTAIVHDYFFNRGVPGSAITIPSASEPVYLYNTSIMNILYHIFMSVNRFLYIFSSFQTSEILDSTTTVLTDTLRYRNVLHSVHKLDYPVPACPTVQFCIVMPAAFAVLQKTYPTMRKQCAVPAYGCRSFFLHSSLRCRPFGFHGLAWWTVSVRNPFFFIYIYYR